MSSARKRASRQKAAAEQDRLRQRLMLAEHHGNVMKRMAEAVAMWHDELKAWQNCAAALLAQFISLTAHPEPQEWGAVALEATRLLNMGPNVQIEGQPASGLSLSNAGFDTRD